MACGRGKHARALQGAGVSEVLVPSPVPHPVQAGMAAEAEHEQGWFSAGQSCSFQGEGASTNIY